MNLWLCQEKSGKPLGVQGYLLDRYLFRKLKSVRCFSYSEIVEQGEEAGERLRKLCRQAVYGEEPEKIQYAQTVHTYIEKHPSSYAEKHTNEEMYTGGIGSFVSGTSGATVLSGAGG